MSRTISLGVVLAVFLGVWPVLPAGGQFSGFGPIGGGRERTRVKVDLLASQDAVRPGDSLTLAVRFDFVADVHVYGPDIPAGAPAIATQIVPLAPESFTFGQPAFPPGRQVRVLDWTLTEYLDDFTVLIPVRAPDDLNGPQVTFELAAVYQVCSEQACFETYDRDTPPLTLTLPVRPAGSAVAATHGELFAAAATQADLPATATTSAERAGELITGGGDIFNIRLGANQWVLGLLLSMVVGLALNLTPCVLPVIPLTVGYFVYQSQHAGRSHKAARRAIMLSGWAFTIGLVATFLLLGGLVRLASQQLQVVFQWPESMLALGLFIVVMALGMFGVYPVQLPAFLARHSGGRSGLGGAVMMGVLAAVLSTPCTGPFIGSMIAWTLSVPPAVGMAAFLGIGLGMAAPYLLLTALPGLLDNVPRSGKWTDRVKVGLGFILLALGLSVLTGLRDQPARWQFALWAALAVSAGVWFVSNVVTDKLLGGSTPAWIARLLILAALAAGVVFYWPSPRTTGQGVQWQDYSPALLAQAARDDQPVLIDLVQANCTNCEIMERRVWQTPEAAAAVEGMVAVKANTSLDAARHLPQVYGTIGAPSIVVLDGDGQMVARFSPVEFYNDLDGFLRAMQTVRRELNLPPATP